MKYIKSFLVLAVAIFTFSLIEVSAQSQQIVSGKSPAQGIERKVFKEILKLPYYGLFDQIAYKVDGGTVTLYGKVINATNRKSAERVVKDISGVENVVNNIEILPLSSFDDSIRYGIVNEFDRRGGSLYRYLQGTNPSMRIIVENGHVTLEGYVSNRSDVNLAKLLANSIFGVFSVQSNLIVEKDQAS